MIAVTITSTIGLIGILGGKWVADQLGLFIGWTAVLAIMIVAAELWTLAQIMKRVHASAAAEMAELASRSVRQAA